MDKHKRILKTSLLLIGATFAVSFFAQTSSAQNVTQGYGSDQTLQKGMIVRLKPNDGAKVQTLSQQDETEMLGVVVASTDAPVSLSQTNVAGQVFIATYGKYDILVSSQNGAIKVGDLLTTSSLAGIAMKASNSQQIVVGKALAAFDGKANTSGTTQLKTGSGEKEVALGRVSADIAVSRNPLYAADQKVAGVPSFLSKIAQSVTNREVSAFRIYASLAVLALSILVAGIILFSGVRTGMKAIGRNPLAKHTISRSLVQVTLMALIVFVIGVFAVYLLLRI